MAWLKVVVCVTAVGYFTVQPALRFNPIPNLSPLSLCISTNLKFSFYRGKESARCEQFCSASEGWDYGNGIQGAILFSACPYFVIPHFQNGCGDVPDHGRRDYAWTVRDPIFIMHSYCYSLQMSPIKFNCAITHLTAFRKQSTWTSNESGTTVHNSVVCSGRLQRLS